MPENRRAPRRKVLKGGKIAFSEHFAAIDCVVRNLSETGAALEVESPVGIPDRFDLLVSGEIAERLCHVAWRSGRRIGVRFER